MQFLAIIKAKAETPREVLMTLMKSEVTKGWDMFEAGVFRSMHYIPGDEGPIGAVLMLEAKDREEADSYLGQLPMVEHGVVSLETLRLVPYSGFKLLFVHETPSSR